MTSNINRKIDALLDAFESDKGIDLIVQALGEPVREVREVAYWLLTEIKEEAAKQALMNYLPYAQMQCLYTIMGHSESEPNYFAISTNKKALLSNCHSKDIRGYLYETIKIWDLQTGELTHTLPFWHEHMGTGQDGKIIVGNYQHVIRVWKNWENEIKYPPFYLGIRIEESRKINNAIGFLAVSQDGSIVACGEMGVGSFQLITVWDLQAEKLIHSIQWRSIRNFSYLSAVMISPDKSLLLSQEKTHSRQDDVHRLWSMQTGELIRVFETSPCWFDAIANTPDGGCVVSGIRDNSVKVWDINTEEVIYSFSGCHPVPDRSPTAMTPDGKILAYCNDANEIVLWDLEIDQKIYALPRNTSSIRSICLSSDREWVVSYDAEQTIRIYGLLDE